MDPLYLAMLIGLGLLTGFLAGMLGIGGGLLLVPFLVWTFSASGFPAAHVLHMAVATSLATILFTSVSSINAHHRRRAVRWDIVRWMAAGALVGTFVGAQVASQIGTRALAIIFALFMGYSGIDMLRKARRPQARIGGPLPRGPVLLGAGGGIGFVASLIGAGGGFLTVPFLGWRGVPIREAVGSSAAVGFGIATGGLLGYVFAGWHLPGMPPYTLGFIDLPALGCCAAASVATAPLGRARRPRVAASDAEDDLRGSADRPRAVDGRQGMAPGMSVLEMSSIDAWHGQAAAGDLRSVIERGGVVVCPALAFAVTARERALFDPSLADARRKSVYLRAGRPGIRGTTVAGGDLAAVTSMIERYAAGSHALVDGLFPRYDALRHATGTSFRPRAIGDAASGKALSWRKDDTRLHVDAFPSNPTHGARILRVFTNVHPGTVPRSWRVGEPFAAMAGRFLPGTRALPPGGAWLMHRLGITKRPRSAYDHLMLQLHDRAKADLVYQRDCPQRAFDFMPGTTWVCFSDQVMHAAMAGQFMFEQTYRLPLACIADVDASPLRVLERLTGRTLV